MHPRPVVFSKWLRWRYAAIFKYSAACCWRSQVSTSFKCALRGIDYTNSSRFNRIHSTNSEHWLHVRFVVKRSSVIKYRSYLICVLEQLPNPPEYINDQFKVSRNQNIYIYTYVYFKNDLFISDRGGCSLGKSCYGFGEYSLPPTIMLKDTLRGRD